MAEILTHYPQELELKAAILIYESTYLEETKAFRLATTHPVINRPGQIPILGAGVPLSLSALKEFQQTLTPQDNPVVELLPPNILLCSPQKLVWYSQPTTRPLWIKNTTIQGTLVPHPPLLWIWGSQVHVFALGNSKRPTLNTPLFQAPYFNVDHAGTICFGNVQLPTQQKPSETEVVEKAFFTSQFSHPLLHGSPLAKFSGSHEDMWKALQGQRRFPKAWLAPNQKTLQSLLF